MLFSGSKLKKVLFSLLLLGIAFFLYTRHREIEERGSLQWYERPVIWVTAPVAQGFLFIRQKVRAAFERYFFLVGVEKENELLRRRAEEFQTKETLFRNLEGENERLRRLLEVRSQMPEEWLAARVVSYPPIGPYRILTIDKGAGSGVRRRAPVIAPDGLVGQVVRVLEDYSQVLLITDPTSAVDGRLEKTGARGLIVGKAVKLGLNRDLFLSAFEYLSQATEIEEGAVVVTSGLDGVYPPGIPIGSVHGKKKKKYDVFQQAEVIPAVDFYKIQQVLVLK